MKTETIKIYKFEELSKDAKETAIENERNDEFYLSYDWFDGLHEEFKEELNTIGVDCEGFFWDIYRKEFTADKIVVGDYQK